MALLGTIKNSFYILVILFLFSCENNKKIQTPVVKKEIIEKKVDVPTFNVDSAYFFVEQQVLFGPRAPNSVAHQKCGNYLDSKLTDFGAKMFIQEAIEQRFLLRNL